MKKIFKILVLSLVILIFNSNKTNATTFSDMSYNEAKEYTELESRVVAESSEQAINLFKMVSSWEAYGSNDTQKSDDIKKYIESAKNDYAFINDASYNVGKEMKSVYNLYIQLMNKELTENGVDSLINGPIIFIDFLEKNIGDTQKNFLSFKKDGLTSFLNSYIYTNSNKIAINKILSGNNSDEQVEGINSLKETISKLEEVSNNKQVPLVIRNYAKEYIQYYKEVINKKMFSNSKKFLTYEEFRVSGLFPIGVEFESKRDFETYAAIFNHFTDYPTLDLSLNLSVDKIKKNLESIINQNPKTESVQELKKLHYEFIYELSQYKETKDIDKLTKSYEDFYDKYLYLNNYFSKLEQRFGNLSGSIVLQELSKIKEQAKCIDPNYKNINDMNFNPNYKTDSNSYREFKIAGSVFSLSNILSSSYIIPIVGVIILVIVIKIISKAKGNSNGYSNDYEEDDDYEDWR